jgi:predicted amidohydrolase
MMNENRVACIQMTSNEDISQNLYAAKNLIQQAAEQGAKLIVLPEMFGIMGLDQMDKVKYGETLGKGPIQDFLSERAAEYGVWLVGGTIPILTSQDSNKVFASCLVFNDQGERVACYNKIHLFDVQLRASQENYSESATTERGDEIVVVPTPFGKLGLAVCYDIRFPEMFRLMLKQGVEIIALPAAFTYVTGSAHWDILVKARAIENLSYVLTACQTGTHANGRKTYGHSMIVNPWGEVQVCLPENPGVVMAEINTTFLQQIRNDFPAISHRKKI